MPMGLIRDKLAGWRGGWQVRLCSVVHPHILGHVKKLNWLYWLARYWLTQFSLTNYCRQLQVNRSTDALLTAISKYRHPHPSSEYWSLYMYVSRHRREPNIKRIVWLYYCDKHMKLIIMRLFLLILTTVVNCATFDLIERLNELKGGSSSTRTGQ